MKIITIDDVAEAMEHGWLVSWTIAGYIMTKGTMKFEKEKVPMEMIDQVDRIIKDNKLTMSVIGSN